MRDLSKLVGRRYAPVVSDHIGPSTAPKRVLIIGGSGGIGANVARELASGDRELVLHGRSPTARLEQLTSELRRRGSTVHSITRPIETAEDGLVVLSEAGPIDLLVVAFGPYREEGIPGATPESFRSLMELNYVLPAALIAGVLPGMIERNYGRILVFGTTFGDRLVGFKKSAGYAAAKTALASLVKSTARQTADVNVRCNMICPGYVVTCYHDEDTAARYAARMPAGRAQSAKSIATVARWLLGEENEAVNGAIVTADTGL